MATTFPTPIVKVFMYFRAEINADLLRTIFVTFFPYKSAGFCTKIFQHLKPNNRPSKHNCDMFFASGIRSFWTAFDQVPSSKGPKVMSLPVCPRIFIVKV